MLTIGELLKLKAREGVTVILHVWNEMCSVSMNGRELTKGMMETHDEETFLYFKDSGVDCRFVPRSAPFTQLGSDLGCPRTESTRFA